jgi:hypothetical protein
MSYHQLLERMLLSSRKYLIRSYGMVCLCFSISQLFFDCRLTAIQDRDSSSSGDREDVIVKSEVIGTEMMPGIVIPFDLNYLRLNRFNKVKGIILLINFLLLFRTFQTLPDMKDSQSNKNQKVIMIYSFPKRPYFKIVMIDSANTRLELRVKEEPTEIQLPERRFSSLSDRKQLPRPSTSRTTKEIPPRQLAPNNNSTRYNSNVQVKPEPVDDTKAFFSSNNRHVPVPHDRQRSMFPPAEDGNSQPSRDPRKRPSK